MICGLGWQTDVQDELVGSHRLTRGSEQRWQYCSSSIISIGHQHQHQHQQAARIFQTRAVGREKMVILLSRIGDVSCSPVSFCRVHPTRHIRMICRDVNGESNGRMVYSWQWHANSGAKEGDQRHGLECLGEFNFWRLVWTH